MTSELIMVFIHRFDLRTTSISVCNAQVAFLSPPATSSVLCTIIPELFTTRSLVFSYFLSFLHGLQI